MLTISMITSSFAFNTTWLTEKVKTQQPRPNRALYRSNPSSEIGKNYSDRFLGALTAIETLFLAINEPVEMDFPSALTKL